MKKKKANRIKIKTYTFIDASNIIYGASDNRWKVDFNKLIRYLKTRYSSSRVLYYAGLDNENIKQIKFYEKLQELGYTLRLVMEIFTGFWNIYWLKNRTLNLLPIRIRPPES